MTTRTLQTILSLVFLIFLTACNNLAPSEEQAETFELGVTKDGHYHNDFFDLDIYFDPTWSVQDKEQIEFMEQVGEKMIVGDNKNLKAVLDAATINTAYLLTIFKHPIGAAVEYNPNFIALVENVRTFPGIETGADYLFHVQKLLGQTAMNYHFSEVYEKRVGTKLFHVLELSANYMGIEIKQSYWSTLDKGFCLSFILSYSTEKEQEELAEIVNKMRI